METVGNALSRVPCGWVGRRNGTARRNGTDQPTVGAPVPYSELRPFEFRGTLQRSSAGRSVSDLTSGHGWLILIT